MGMWPTWVPYTIAYIAAIFRETIPYSPDYPLFPRLSPIPLDSPRYSARLSLIPLTIPYSPESCMNGSFTVIDET